MYVKGLELSPKIGGGTRGWSVGKRPLVVDIFVTALVSNSVLSPRRCRFQFGSYYMDSIVIDSVMDITVFRDFSPCSLVDRYQPTGATCYLLQGRTV